MARQQVLNKPDWPLLKSLGKNCVICVAELYVTKLDRVVSGVAG